MFRQATQARGGDGDVEVVDDSYAVCDEVVGFALSPMFSKVFFAFFRCVFEKCFVDVVGSYIIAFENIKWYRHF